jgi:hypothetical protein
MIAPATTAARHSSKQNTVKHLFAHLLSATRIRAKYASFSASVCKVSRHDAADGVKSLNQGINIPSRAAHRNRTSTGLWLFYTGTRTVPLGIFFSFFTPNIIWSGCISGRTITAVYTRFTGSFIKVLL